jgi:maltose O-acetyltransferase
MRSEREKMLAGDLYDPNDAELSLERRRARELCRTLNSSQDTDVDLRRSVLITLFASCGAEVKIEPPFFCDYGSNIELGDKVFFNFNCVILDGCKVRIGNGSMFGPAVQIYTATHPLNAELRQHLELGKPVDIGSEVWVGGGAIILPGVTIGSRSVIGAGSVVTRDIPEGVIAAGNPCRVLREVPQD